MFISFFVLLCQFLPALVAVSLLHFSREGLVTPLFPGHGPKVYTRAPRQRKSNDTYTHRRQRASTPENATNTSKERPRKRTRLPVRLHCSRGATARGAEVCARQAMKEVEMTDSPPPPSLPCEGARAKMLDDRQVRARCMVKPKREWEKTA